MPSMLVHDGILFELDNEEQVEHAIEIMRAAGAEVCGGLAIGVDVDQKLISGARYRTNDQWRSGCGQRVMETLPRSALLRRVG